MPLRLIPGSPITVSEFQLRVNGIYGAWMGELGHDNAQTDALRAGDPYRIANVSYSLVQREEDGRLLRHTLIDAGLGVMQSLLDFEHHHGVRVVHEVLLSHSHFDHVAHLDWLSSVLDRNGREEQPRPLPVYCTPPCWEIGPERLFPWLVDTKLRHHPVAPGEVLRFGELRITPLGVQHGATAPGAVGFAVEHRPAGAGTGRKIVLTCDFLTVNDPDDPGWHDADICFIESNTWNPCPHTGHQSILEGIELIRCWKPKRTYLIHYSGFEDAEHPGAEINRVLTFDELQEQVKRHAPDLDIRVARHGMIFPLDEPWP